MKKILLFLVFILLTGCSRKYFEPKDIEVSKPIIMKEHKQNEVLYFTKKVATLDNYLLLPSHKQLPKGFLGMDEELSKNGNILRVNGKNIKFDSLIVTAKRRDNLVAILFGDNHFELYDLNAQKTISNEMFGDFLALRKFVAQPYFYKDLLLIPTLNGKMEIYDLKQNKIIRSIVVSQKDYFNNIIYLGVKNDNLVVASRDNLIVVAPNLVVNKFYNIKHILVDENNIYVFTIEGEIIKLNFDLKEIRKKQFQYANIIFPMFYKDKIYFLIRGDEAFLVSIDKKLENYQITPLKIVENDDCQTDFLYLKTNVFGVNGVYYIGDFILKLK